MGYYDDQVRRDLRAAETELGQRRQTEARIRELHTHSFGNEYGDLECDVCRDPWPCETLRAFGATS